MPHSVTILILLLAIGSAPAASTAMADSGQMLAELDRFLVTERIRAERLGTSAVAFDRLASAHLRRFRLGGRWSDLDAAERAVVASRYTGGGNPMVAARVAATLHRYDEAEAEIARAERAILVSDRQRAAIARLRGEMALAAGDFHAAETAFQAAITAWDDPSARAGLALVAAARGDHQQAEAGFLAALEQVPPRDQLLRAWLHLQRGLLDLERGQLAAADLDYAAADDALPGWWLVAEHRAEIQVLQGQASPAAETYRQIVAATGRPEFMDALADCLEAMNSSAAAPMRLRARDAWNRVLERFPAAAGAHALDHLLSSGQAERALALAEAQQDTLGGPESGLLVARSLLALGRAEAALTAIEPVLASPWMRSEKHTVAADIYQALGRETDARRHAAWSHPDGNSDR